MLYFKGGFDKDVAATSPSLLFFLWFVNSESQTEQRTLRMSLSPRLYTRHNAKYTDDVT